MDARHKGGFPARHVVKDGAVGGLISGLVFSFAASLAAVAQGKPWDAPVRLVAAVALGRSTFEPRAPLLPALVWGMALHLGYTIAAGMLFAALVAYLPALRRSAAAAAVVALLYALAQWLAGFYLVAPLFGWGWFTGRTEVPMQSLLQVGVWGGAMAAYFARGGVRRALARTGVGHHAPLRRDRRGALYGTGNQG